ncbi:hypothetical protein [Cochleicola gelatinilyticus]|uniref:Secreted protein n=1 Tax=Cochleicola gelatinilyticus TaxID=1763537 RepID=A0A167IPU0_9FLAO|nr:hypothetical protein [Cochleicola gelatinilyticus]OAB79892.1 hypothetical protein ULVI_03895 [Cochleicola gelatinilyticus]
MKLFYVVVSLLISLPLVTSCEADSLEEEQLLDKNIDKEVFQNLKDNPKTQYSSREEDSTDTSDPQRDPDTGDQGNPIDEGHDDDD